jgi:hypothetical protein
MADHSAAKISSFTVTNGTYDSLKRLVEIILPGLGTMYFGLSVFWPLPYVDSIVGSIAVICVFLGLVLRDSSKNYTPEAPNEMGSFVINTTEIDRAPYRLELDADLADLEKKDTISFRVKNSG